MTRKFSEYYEYREILDVFAISRSLLRQIEYYLENEALSDMDRKFLSESKKTIGDLLTKYGKENDVISKISREQIDFGFSEMCDNPKYKNLSPEDFKKTYENSSITLRMIKQDFERICEIEDTIHNLITIPLWKKSMTSMDVELKPGDEFLYIVHAGENIIYLPGYPNYQKTRNFNGDYVSASLLTDKQMAMFGSSRVGLILKPNEAIVCATAVDSGTHFIGTQNPRTVIDFQNGNYIESGFPGDLMSSDNPLATTKIQAPNQLTEDTIKRQKDRGHIFSNRSEDVNEVVLDDSKVEVIGVFFKTNGCEINLKDFERAVIMGKQYNVPVKIVNSSIYRKKLGLEPYEPEDLQGFERDLEFWGNSENWKKIIKNPEEDRELLKRYFTDVVVKQQYEPEIKKKIEDVFTRIIEYTYNGGNSEKTEGTKKVDFDE